MQIKLRRKSLAGPSDRTTTASRLLPNIFQGTNLVRPRRDSKPEAQQSYPVNLHPDRLRPLQILIRDPAGKQYT